MEQYNIPLGIVGKAAKMLSQESATSLSQCRETISKAIGYNDYYDLGQNGPSKLGVNNLATSHSTEAETRITALIASQLDVSPVTVHHILANTLFHNGQPPNMDHALKVISGVFERTVLPQQGKRQSGQIGKLKSSARNGEHVILRDFGRVTQIMSHQSANAIVADFEYVSPTKPLPLFIPMRLYMPYGFKTEDDGSRVLFSRDYLPMWRLRKGKKPERMKPWEQIYSGGLNFVLPEGDMPWHNSNNFTVCLRFLEHEGIRSFPLSLDALPLIVKDNSVSSYKDAVKALKTLTDTSQSK
jgi:hypothetical protein